MTFTAKFLASESLHACAWLWHLLCSYKHNLRERTFHAVSCSAKWPKVKRPDNNGVTVLPTVIHGSVCNL